MKRRFGRLSFPSGPQIFSHCWHEAEAGLFFCLTITPIVLPPRTKEFPLMSNSHLAAASSSSNFQVVIDNALKAYEKRTKNDLLAHPLASQLQACDSPAAILAVLQQQAQELDQSRSSDDRWTKWLDPTISVLYTFSATLGAGVGLVCPRTCVHLNCTSYTYPTGILACECYLYRNQRSPFSAYPTILNKLAWVIINTYIFRLLRMPGQAKTLLWTSLSASKVFFDASRSTQKCHRPRR